MSKLESAMGTLMEVFHYYSSKEGDKFRLNRRELKNLLQGEFGDWLENNRDRQVLTELLDDLDKNQDGTVSFEEFMIFVTMVTVHTRDFFSDYTPLVMQCGQMKDGTFYKL